MKFVSAIVALLAIFLIAGGVIAQPQAPAPAPAQPAPAPEAPAVVPPPALAAPAQMAPPPMPKMLTVTGTVKVTKGENGLVTALEIVEANGTVHSVALTREGKKLEQEDGKKVVIDGVVMEVGGKEILHVGNFRPATETPPAAK
jgi:hypothetical protein